ncbi:MAG: magnesium transporter [Firmicutes bacterium]|nr:magnesium transporter [Bacillota bacterium]
MRRIDFSTLNRLVEAKQLKPLKEALADFNVVDLANFIEQLNRESVVYAFRALPKDIAAQVFSYLSFESQEFIVQSITDQEIGHIINDLFSDDAADLIEELPANVVKKVLRNASPEVRNTINQLLQYPAESAGSIMTAEFVDLKKHMTVGEAFARIRRTAFEKETVYTCYVIDEHRRLEGVISVKRLLVTPDDTILSQVMETNIIKVTTTDDQELVAHLFAKYGLLSLPVVDHENRLVGIVTIDDVIDVIHEEATEDFERMAAMLPSEKPYLKTSVLSLAKNRFAWLLFLMVSGMIVGSILAKYEEAFVAIPLLVTFIPMLTDTGGNAGSQSSTLVIRGMALSEIRVGDFLKVFFKEFRVSLIVGLGLSIANFIRIMISYKDPMIALTVSLSLYLTVVIAKTVGGILPIFAKLVKADPAIMAAPIITTVVDALSLMLYFRIAVVLLKL